jgi:hypothetical protein
VTHIQVDLLAKSLSLSYFFLNPAGHLGLIAVTFLATLPLTQVIDFEEFAI